METKTSLAVWLDTNGTADKMRNDPVTQAKAREFLEMYERHEMTTSYFNAIMDKVYSK